MRYAAFLMVVTLVGCGGSDVKETAKDLAAVAKEVAPELKPALPHVSGAMTGNPSDWFNIGSYVSNAALIGWAAWERRRRNRERKEKLALADKWEEKFKGGPL